MATYYWTTEMFPNILRLLNEISTGRWSEEILLRIANQGHRNIIRSTDCIWKSGTVAATANIWEYAKPTGCIKILRADYDDRPLVEISLDTLDIAAQNGVRSVGFVTPHIQDTAWASWLNNKWASITGEPFKFYQRTDKIGLYPTPDGSYTITVEYVYFPADISASQNPFNDQDNLRDYYEIITHYTAWRCLMEKEDELGLKRSWYLEKLYRDGIKQMKKDLKDRPRIHATASLHQNL